MRRILLVGVSVLMAGTLTGCSSLRLYSEARDKQGEAAKGAWSKLDAKSVIVAQRENNAKLLKEELNAQDRMGTAIRDLSIRQAALKWTGTDLESKIDQALKTTVGDHELFAKWQQAYQKQQDETAKLRFIGPRFEVRGLELPACELLLNDNDAPTTQKTIKDWDAVQPDDRKLQTQYTALQKQCEKIKDATTEADKLKAGLATGELRTLLTALSREEAALLELRTKHQAARNALRVAQAEYDAAVAKTKVEPSAGKTVGAAADKVGKALGALLAADDALSLKLVSETRLDAIDSFFSVLSSTPEGEPFPKDAPKAAVALKVIPELADNARTALAGARQPLLVPLVMRKNHEQLNVEAASREILAKETLLELQRSRFELLHAKGTRLREAKCALNGVPACFLPPLAQPDPNTCTDKATCALAKVSQQLKAAKLGEINSAACKEPSPTPPNQKDCADQRASIRSASARYFDAIGRLDTEARKAEYKQFSAKYDEALALAEVNVLQWDALIGTSVDQLAAYGKSGIRAEHILALINSLSLLWIGSGVN